MRTKTTILALLTVVALGASVQLIAPSAAEASQAVRFSCTNTSCHGQPLCFYDAGWNCYLAGGNGSAYCDGHELCPVE